MVQVSSGVPGPSGRLTTYTYTCSFCDREYQTDKQSNGALQYCCGEKPCQLERNRRYKFDAYQASRLQEDGPLSWDERTDGHGPGDEVGTFIAKLTGSKFTPSGAIALTFLALPEYKRVIFDVTDYSGMLVNVTIKRPEE